MKAIKVNGQLLKSLWYIGKKKDGFYEWFIETTLDETKALQYENSNDGDSQLRAIINTLQRKYNDVQIVDIEQIQAVNVKQLDNQLQFDFQEEKITYEKQTAHSNINNENLSCRKSQSY